MLAFAFLKAGNPFVLDKMVVPNAVLCIANILEMLSGVEWMTVRCSRLQATCLQQDSFNNKKMKQASLSPRDKHNILAPLWTQRTGEPASHCHFLCKCTTPNRSPSGHLRSAVSFCTALNTGMTTQCFPPFQNLHPTSSRIFPSIVKKFSLILHLLLFSDPAPEDSSTPGTLSIRGC